MQLATDVRLPLDHVPVFPRVCCGCLGERPAELIGVGGSRATIWEWVMPWLALMRRRVRVEVPACASCRDRWRRRWWLVRAAFVALVAIGMAVALWLRVGAGLPRGWRRIVGGASALLFALPILVWVVVRPPLVALTVDAEHVDYEFANGAYADRFRLLNATPPHAGPRDRATTRS